MKRLRLIESPNHSYLQNYYPSLSKYRPSLVEDYESQISLPLPLGTIIMEGNAMCEYNNYFSLNNNSKDAANYYHGYQYSNPNFMILHRKM